MLRIVPIDWYEYEEINPLLKSNDPIVPIPLPIKVKANPAPQVATPPATI